MKRVGTLIIILALVSLAGALLVFAQKQTQKLTSRTVSPNSGNAGAGEQVAKTKGRNLVKKLPDGVGGVALAEGLIRLKPGYRFVKGKNGKVSVYLMRGGGGAIGGDWECTCSSIGKTNDCKASIAGGFLTCLSGAECTGCDLSVTVGKWKQAVIAF